MIVSAQAKKEKHITTETVKHPHNIICEKSMTDWSGGHFLILIYILS